RRLGCRKAPPPAAAGAAADDRRIERHRPAHRSAALDLAIRAWTPVFARLRGAVPQFVYDSFWPDGWQARQRDDLARLLDETPGDVHVAVIAGTVVGWVCTRIHAEDTMGGGSLWRSRTRPPRPGSWGRGGGTTPGRGRGGAGAGCRDADGHGGDRRRSGARARPAAVRGGRLPALAGRPLLQGPHLRAASAAARSGRRVTTSASRRTRSRTSTNGNLGVSRT